MIEKDLDDVLWLAEHGFHDMAASLFIHDFIEILEKGHTLDPGVVNFVAPRLRLLLSRRGPHWAKVRQSLGVEPKPKKGRPKGRKDWPGMRRTIASKGGDEIVTYFVAHLTPPSTLAFTHQRKITHGE